MRSVFIWLTAIGLVLSMALLVAISVSLFLGETLWLWFSVCFVVVALFTFVVFPFLAYLACRLRVKESDDYDGLD